MNYKITVITPFHNVEESMFKNCVQSMLNQTIGFENIEWIVVLHNCQEEYIQMAKRYLDKYPNVKLPVLNNDIHTPSSPRNYAFTHATAPYIGYLDGDDSYTPECLETATSEMQDTRSQVVIFRRDYELEKESLGVYSEKILWNQTQWRIVLERDQWQQDKMFSELWGFTTSKIFDREFLLNNHITFDETMTFAEDFMYTAQSMFKADRICYLPQLIGYHYFINGSSMLQFTKKDPLDIIGYFRTVSQLFDLMDSNGIEFNWTAQMLYCLFIGFMYNSDLTPEHRQTIKQITEPYIKRFHKVEVTKIITPEMAEMWYRMPQEVLLNPEHPRESAYVRDCINGWRKLITILRENSKTDFGAVHSFSKIRTLDAYRRSVPKTSYEDYQRLVLLQTNIGETGILTKDKIERYFLCTDGNGLQYLIPCTETHFLPYMETFATTLANHHNILIASSNPSERETNDNATVDTMESMMVKDYLAKYLYARGRRRADFTAPDSSFYGITPEPDYYAMARYALADKEADQMVALTTESIVKFFQCIQANWQQLVNDVRTVNPHRADEIEPILYSSFSRNTDDSGEPSLAALLWPNLQRIVAFGAGELYESTRQMKQYTGAIPHNHGYYYTEECILGKAKEDDSDIFTYFEDDCFIECQPLRENTDNTCFYTDLEVDAPCALIITNKAGLYRYESPHIICPKKIQNSDFEFNIY